MTKPKTDSKRPIPAKSANTAKAPTVKSRVGEPAAKTTAAKPEAKSPVKAKHAELAKVKHKLIRDSFTIPKSEYTVLEGLKTRATDLKRPVKKSELLRAGIAVLHKMTDKAFVAALAGIPSLKTGRPKKPEVTASAAGGSVE